MSPRVNLGRIGFLWDGRLLEAAEISGAEQMLNLYTGHLSSKFTIYGFEIDVQTVASPSVDAVGVLVRTDAFMNGSLSVFVDLAQEEYRFNSALKDSQEHDTSVQVWGQRAQIEQRLEGLVYYAGLEWMSERPVGKLESGGANSQRFVVSVDEVNSLELSVRWSQTPDASVPGFEDVKAESGRWWREYWHTGAFVDCNSSTTDPRAKILQNRVLLSQYLMAVNAAGTDVPQDNGFLSNSVLSKKGMDVALWNLAHWGRWGKWERLGSVVPGVYERLLQPAMKRAAELGLKGARWGADLDHPNSKESTPKVDTEPVWPEMYPFYFAELEYNAYPTDRTLKKWHRILEETITFMGSYFRHNLLLPQLKTTRNPALDLASWRFSLNITKQWYHRQNLTTPDKFSSDSVNVGSFLWAYGTDSANVTGFEAVPTLSLFGLLPPEPGLNMTVVRTTFEHIERSFNISTASSTDVPLLGMSAVRMGDAGKAIDWLTHPSFKFDDAGYPVSNDGQDIHLSSSGGLLLAVGMLADGWTGSDGGKWPKDWSCEVEGFTGGI